MKHSYSPRKFNIELVQKCTLKYFPQTAHFGWNIKSVSHCFKLLFAHICSPLQNVNIFTVVSTLQCGIKIVFEKKVEY